jgi:hypothetical protein
LTPQTSATSPTSGKDKDAQKEKDNNKDNHKDPGDKSTPDTSADDQNSDDGEIEALSEMMCSLVTNHYGETRYFGENALS